MEDNERLIKDREPLTEDNERLIKDNKPLTKDRERLTIVCIII
jgi:hypothetical protein